MGEGSKPGQLYIFIFLYFIFNIVQYFSIWFNVCHLYVFNITLNISDSWHWGSIFKGCFLKTYVSKIKDINLSQYAKMYLVYVQVARPFTTWNKQASLKTCWTSFVTENILKMVFEP